MSWSKVGEWIKDNAGNSAALVGSLLTGNVPGAVAAGVSMVAGVTGTDDPGKSLLALQGNPEMMVKLERVRNERDAEVGRHIEAIALIKSENEQAEHEQTQLTVRNGDNAEGGVKWVRPMHSTASLVAGMVYCYAAETVDFNILGLWLALPFSYAGLRQVGKWRTNTK